jgi:hypothetical protein
LSSGPGRGSSPSAKAPLVLPLSPDIFWVFDEILRNGVLFYLGRSPNIYIEMPTANRTF